MLNAFNYNYRESALLHQYDIPLNCVPEVRVTMAKHLFGSLAQPSVPLAFCPLGVLHATIQHCYKGGDQSQHQHSKVDAVASYVTGAKDG